MLKGHTRREDTEVSWGDLNSPGGQGQCYSLKANTRHEILTLERWDARGQEDKG